MEQEPITDRPADQKADATAKELGKEVHAFLKGSLPVMAKTIFLSPIDGIRQFFSHTNERAFFNALVLITATFAIGVLVPYLTLAWHIGGGMMRMIGFSHFIKVGIALASLLVIISIFVFIIKSLSGKADFKKELLTGGLCGIPVSVFLVLMGLLGQDLFGNMLYQGANALMSTGAASAIVVLYMLLFMFNIVQQSLKGSGTHDALAWYLSPVVVLLSMYLAFEIGAALF